MQRNRAQQCNVTVSPGDANQRSLLTEAFCSTRVLIRAHTRRQVFFKGLLPLGTSLTVWFIGRRWVSAGHTLHVLKTNKFGLPVKSRIGKRDSWLLVSSKITVAAKHHIIGHQQPLEPALGEDRGTQRLSRWWTLHRFGSLRKISQLG